MRCVKAVPAAMQKAQRSDSVAEDTCVPPEHLADYIAEFRALLDSHGLSWHVRPRRCAVLRTRPALTTAAGDPDEARSLTMWWSSTAKYASAGEHGKGFREIQPAWEQLLCGITQGQSGLDP